MQGHKNPKQDVQQPKQNFASCALELDLGKGEPDLDLVDLVGDKGCFG